MLKLMVTLRDYQMASVEAIINQWKTVQSTLLVMATGLGKTIVFADLIRRMQPKRALVFAHREELIFQAREKIEGTTGLKCDLEMADQYARSDLFGKAPVVIATIQTLTSGRGEKRFHRFKPTDFDIIICDESHHSTSRTYVQVFDYWKLNPNCKFAGFTATPHRTDKQALGQIYQSVAARFDIQDGIDGGWLCPITQFFVPVSTLDYSHIEEMRTGDFNPAQLAAVMEAEENIAGVCQPSLEVIFALPPHSLDNIPVPQWNDYLKSLNKVPRRTIVFTASVLQAELCCNIFNRAFPDIAQWVCGETNKDKRRTLLDQFQTGETPVMMNCGVLTEGYDNPHVEVIIMARPTKSETLYRQMVGRSTRPLPGIVDGPPTAVERKAAIRASQKKYCRIIDFVGVTGDHHLINCSDILGGNRTPEVRARAMADMVASGRPQVVSQAMDKAEVDIETEKRLKAEQRRREEEAKKAHLVPKSKFSMKEVNPFSLENTFKSTSAPKPKRTLTEKQFNLLVRNGYDPTRMPIYLALKKIGEIGAKWRK